MGSRRSWATRGVMGWVFVPLVLALLLAACGGGSAPTPASTPPPTDTPASDSRSGATPAAGSPAVTANPSGNRNLDKVDEVFLRLLQTYQTQGLDAAKQFARDQGLMTSQDEVRITLVLDSADPAVVDGTVLAVGRLGGRVTATFGNQIEMVVPAQALVEYGKQANRQSFFMDLASFQHVRDIRRTPIAQPMEMAAGSTATAKPGAGGKSEGVALIGANTWQAAGITGKGVKVGIVDVGFNRYQQILADAHYTVRSFRSDGEFEAPTADDDTIHGTACAEIVHEVAPDAALYLVRIDTPGSFIAAVDWLVSTVGVSVISASVGQVGFSPTDGTSAQSQAVDKARAAGVFFAVAAGNDASGEIGSDSGEGHYGAVFTDRDADGFHDFSGTRNADGLIVRASRDRSVRIVLNWDDWARPHVNYDLFLYDSDGQPVRQSTTDQARTGKDPVEFITGTLKTGTYTLKVKKINRGDPDLPFNLFVRGVQIEQSTAGGSLGVPADARGAVTIGAVNVQTEVVEAFSSEGPTLDGRKKPELSGPDGTLSAAYASVGEKRFDGTSAATPHVGGAAALYRQAFPQATPDAILAFFAEQAKPPRGTKRDENSTGFGRLDLGAVPQGASTAPAATRTVGTPRATAIPTIAAQRSPFFTDLYTDTATGLPAQGYMSGSYHIPLPALTGVILPYPQAASGQRIAYEVRAWRASGEDDNAMGLLIGMRGDGAFTLFVVASDGQFAVLEKRDGSLQTVRNWTANGAITTGGGTNSLRVEVNGTQATFSANGVTLTTVTLSEAPLGRFGIVAAAGPSGPAEIAFSNYRVSNA